MHPATLDAAGWGIHAGGVLNETLVNILVIANANDGNAVRQQGRGNHENLYRILASHPQDPWERAAP